jgi:hypothetical protein
MTVVTYGDLPGVEAEVRGGAVAQLTVGYEQKLVIFGRGDQSNGTASYNTPKQVQTSVDATTYFGDGSELAAACSDALANGANPEYVYGVMPTETTVSAEAVAGGSGTLSNAPIVEDASTITVTNTTQSQTDTVVFRYESVPDTSSLAAGEVAINPFTGEFDSGGSDDYEIDYSYLDWSSALDAADTTVKHNETAIYCTLSESESVGQTLSTKLDELRPTYKLIRGVTGAQPNDTNTDGEPAFDTSNYTDTLDNDALFAAAPVRISGSTKTVLGGIGGRFAGNALTNPIYGDVLKGFDNLTQELTPTEEGDPKTESQAGSGLRGEQVMPIRDDGSDGGDGLTIEDSLSTSTASDWIRDYHRRRIVDQILLSARTIGETARGRRMTDTLIGDTEEQVVDVLIDFANDGLIETSGNAGQLSDSTSNNSEEDGEQDYSATITRTDTDTLALTVSFTPIGVTKNIQETIVVSNSRAA